MTEPAAAHARDVGDYLALARRRWGWIATAVLVGLTLSLGYLVTAEKTYVSVAQVLVKPTGTTQVTAVGARTNDAINLDTEAQLVRSEPVSARAAQIVGTTLSPVALAQSVTITVPANTTVMDIAFSASTAQAAQAGAAAYAKAYLEDRRDVAEDDLAGDVDRLRDQIEVTGQQIEKISVTVAQLTEPGDRDERAFLEARRATLNNQLASLNAQLAPLVASVVDAGEVTREAQLPSSPADPDPLLVLPTGLMAGLLVGFGLAAWRERADKRLHDGRDLERLFGIVPLAAIRAGGRGGYARVVHDVRALYHSLRAHGPSGREVVTLVGPDTADGAEHLSYALVLVAARSGSTAAYLARPGSSVVRRRRRSELERRGALRVLDYGKLGVVEDGEFRSANLRAELQGIASERDFVVLGQPNDDPSVDVPILARQVDMAVVVVRLGVTRRDSLAAVLTDLTKSGVDRVLVVLVDLGRHGLRRRPVSVAQAFAAAAEQTGPHPVPASRQPAPGSDPLRAPAWTRPEVRARDDSDRGGERGRNGTSRGVTVRWP